MCAFGVRAHPVKASRGKGVNMVSIGRVRGSSYYQVPLILARHALAIKECQKYLPLVKGAGENHK